MARDAAGFEWGNYHRSKNRPKGRQPTVAIYVLYKVLHQSSFFGEPAILVKIGKTQRHPEQRLTEYRNQTINYRNKHDEFRMLKFWEVKKCDLTELETRVLAEMERRYGRPYEGKEMFLADNMESVLTLVSSVLKK